MQLTQYHGNIRVEFNYNEELKNKIKSIPGSRFNKDPLANFWTFPFSSLEYAKNQQIICDGNLYPAVKSRMSPQQFNALRIETKTDRIKATGPYHQLNDLKTCLIALCSYEDKSEDEYVIKSLAEEIYFKSGILVVTFPKGLNQRVIGFLKVFQFNKFYSHPQSEAPQKSIDVTLNGMIPRPYQIQACEKIQNKDISNRATLVMATGSGKTMLSAMITADLGVPTIFYTYSKDLLNQTATVYEELFQQEIGRIGGNRFTIKPITIASIQTVHSCWEKQDARWDKLSPYLDQVQCMFIDEGHMLGADTIFKVAEITDAHYSYALTATPYREDGKEIFIEAGTGPVIELISEQELVAGGYVLPIEVELYPVQHFMSKKKKYHNLYESEIIDHWERNRMIIRSVRSHQGKQIIILIKEIFHGKKIAEVLNVPFIHGSTPGKERTAVLDAFKNRELDIIVASSILKQGIDLPEAEVMVLAHGGASLVELMQKVGRVRRPAPEKEKGIVIDFYDYILPKMDEDIFRAQSEKRWAFYRSKGFSISKKGENNLSAIL